MFDPSCSGEFNEDQSLFTITTGDGQAIVSATYSINGNDMGNGKYICNEHFKWLCFSSAQFPLDIVVSSLTEANNVIELQLMGSGGSTFIARFTLELGTLRALSVQSSVDYYVLLRFNYPPTYHNS